MTSIEEKLDAELAKHEDLSEDNKKVIKDMWGHYNTLTQGDKLFLRNQLGMKPDEADEFVPAIALWKRRGGGMTEWNFVMAMTDEAVSKELGFTDNDDE